jgi:hypothetical protein
MFINSRLALENQQQSVTDKTFDKLCHGVQLLFTKWIIRRNDALTVRGNGRNVSRK